MMGYLATFSLGILLGVIYEKSIRAWKIKIEKAAKAANTAFHS